MAKVMALMNEKGGTAKSTTATTLAYLLAKRGRLQRSSTLMDEDIPVLFLE